MQLHVIFFCTEKWRVKTFMCKHPHLSNANTSAYRLWLRDTTWEFFYAYWICDICNIDYVMGEQRDYMHRMNYLLCHHSRILIAFILAYYRIYNIDCQSNTFLSVEMTLGACLAQLYNRMYYLKAQEMHCELLTCLSCELVLCLWTACILNISDTKQNLIRRYIRNAMMIRILRTT